jgi:Glutathione synthase/Ribosomal protein S6 modification enzyme (glutaminyl transferase)
VLIRTIWDYHKHPAAFGQWLDRLDRLGVAMLNDSRLLRWNSDKRYLFELARLGVATIPTRLAHGSELARVLASMPGASVVVKPTISGGAWQTLRGEVGDDAFAASVAQLPTALDYLVQPYLPEIASAGEWSLLYFGGEYSHAVIKRPAAGDYRVQSEYGGSVDPVQPDAAILADAGNALSVAAAMGYGDLAYARVDGVISAGHFLIMELELIEPFLFLAEQPLTAERFARQLVSRLDALAARDRGH